MTEVEENYMYICIMNYCGDKSHAQITDPYEWISNDTVLTMFNITDILSLMDNTKPFAYIK